MINRLKKLRRHPVKSFIDMIRFAGLTSNLILCLDAGDIKSFPGAGLIWFDTSGNGNHYIGGGTAATSYPEFVGIPGRGSDFDFWTAGSKNTGNDGFQPLNTVTWDDNVHKNGGQITIFAAIYGGIRGNSWFTILNNTNSSSTTLNNGFTFAHSTFNSRLTFLIDTDNTASSGVSGSTLSGTTSFKIVAVSFDENANIILKNGNATSTTGSGASTNTTNPSFNPNIGMSGVLGEGMIEHLNERIFMIAVWSSALTLAQLNSLGEVIKTQRFPGILT